MAYTENLITIQQQVSNHLLLFHLLSNKYQCKELYLILPKYGVIPFEIRSLKKGHTEARRAQRFYIAEIVRHRGTVGAWRNRGYLRVLLMLWSTSLQSSGLQGFNKYQCKELYLVLPKYGVIPFEIRTLKKGHTEKWRAQRFYKAEIVRHRGTVGAWRNRGYLRVLLMLWSTSLQSSGLQDFLKRLFVYYQSYQQHVHYVSVALCAFGTSVRLSASTSVFSPSLCAFYM